MIIRHITIQNFGSILSYDAELSPEINIIDNRYTDELSAAMAFLLCNKVSLAMPEHCLQADTRISATISLKDATYSVWATPNLGRLQLSVADPSGADATAHYQYALSHCQEQDTVEHFDGQDKTISFRLCGYHDRERVEELSPRTQRLADTKTFRRYLYQYIRNFRSEPINSKKNYQTAINPQGKFEVFHPGFSGKIYLSETEEKLFKYICFLNIAEFWAEFEGIRDLHHEKKPLIIQNFVEFLDESASINGLIERTQKLQRQMIILTGPLREEIKKKWMGV